MTRKTRRSRGLPASSLAIRVLMILALALPGVMAPAPTASAQTYPNRPVKIIVPTPAGGPVDVMARLLANALPAVLGQNVIVENRAGAGNTLGSKAAAAAALSVVKFSPRASQNIFSPKGRSCVSATGRQRTQRNLLHECRWRAEGICPLRRARRLQA